MRSQQVLDTKPDKGGFCDAGQGVGSETAAVGVPLPCGAALLASTPCWTSPSIRTAMSQVLTASVPVSRTLKWQREALRSTFLAEIAEVGQGEGCVADQRAGAGGLAALQGLARLLKQIAQLFGQT